jgi:hypothetical protein
MSPLVRVSFRINSLHPSPPPPCSHSLLLAPSSSLPFPPPCPSPALSLSLCLCHTLTFPASAKSPRTSPSLPILLLGLEFRFLPTLLRRCAVAPSVHLVHRFASNKPSSFLPCFAFIALLRITPYKLSSLLVRLPLFLLRSSSYETPSLPRKPSPITASSSSFIAML